MKNFGFSESEAKQIEAKYHELYKVSDDFVANKIKQAEKDGYVTCAFGLRVRTPILAQTYRGLSNTPHEADAEARTAGNALGQSHCLLTNRAGIEFNERVRESQYKYDIRPVIHIHDAQYFLIKDDPEVVLWVNKWLVHAVQWQNDPAIWHEKVHLGGELSIFWPDWSKECTIPNNITQDELYDLVKKHIQSIESTK